MANAGPDTNGSQFFICIEDCRRKLDPAYNLFGYVIDGLDVAQQVEVGDTMRSVAVTGAVGRLTTIVMCRDSRLGGAACVAGERK